MQLINQHEIYETWAPVLESKTPAGFYAGGSYAGTGLGSGDKFPSLLPLAIQVAAKTVGFDIVPVIPMSGPTGVLSYLDYVYAGGKLSGTDTVSPYTASSPDLIKVPSSTASPVSGLTVGSTYLLGAAGLSSTKDLDSAGVGALVAGKYVGNSRIDGFPIFQVIAQTTGFSIAQAIDADAVIYSGSFNTGTNVYTISATVGYANGAAVLVKTLEDHVQGASGAGLDNTNAWQGPYVDGTKAYDPMSRGTAESTYFKSLGLTTFTKFVEAGTFQVAASVTTEQIQDLNKQFGIDVVSMIENALVNEVSQAINKHILSRAFALGWSNHAEFKNTEGTNLNLNLKFTGGGSNLTFIGKDNAQLVIAGGTAIGTGGYENQSTVQRRLFSRILAAANVVANRGRRGPANFIVTNSQVASALQDISQFTFAPFTNTLTQNNGTLYPVGSIAGMTVYVDQNMSFGDTRVLVGRKGGDDEPGLKFMPYMMAESIQTISEGTMSPKIAVKSRYALVEAGHHPQTMYICFHVEVPATGIA